MTFKDFVSEGKEKLSKLIKKIILSFSGLALLANLSSADLIRLKSGQTVFGIVVGQDETSINVQTDLGTISISTSVIVAIEKESPAMNQVRAGDSYMAHSEWEKALAEYQAAIQIDPKLTEVKSKLAEVQAKLEEAVEEKLKPEFNQGDQLLEKKQFDLAVEYYADLLDHNVSNEKTKPIRRRLAKTYYLWAQDRLDRASKYEAVEDLKKAISFDPTFAEAYFLAADVSKDLANRDEDAIRFYTSGLQLVPTRWKAEYNRGEVYMRRGQLSNAIDDFLVIYQKDTTSLVKSAANQLMFCYWISGKADMDKQNWTAAIAKFENAVQYNNDSAAVYFDLAKAYAQTRQYDKVTTALYRSVTLDNTNAEAYELLGDTFFTLQKYTDAMSPYRRALQIQPNNYKTLCNLSEVYLSKGMNDDAQDMAQRAIKFDPNAPQGYYELGMVYEKKEADQDALKAYQKTESIKSDDIKIHLALGRVYKKVKQYEQALNEFQAAIKINPQLPQARNEMGLTNMALGNYFNAISDFQSAIDIDSTFIQAYVNMGDAYRAKKNYDAAIEIYQKGIDVNPNFPDSYLGLGIIAHDYQKDYTAALDYYNSYLDHGGKMNDQLQQWMKEVTALQSQDK